MAWHLEAAAEWWELYVGHTFSFLPTLTSMNEASLPVVKLDVRESLSARLGGRLLKPRRLAQSARELSIVVTSPSPLPNCSTTSLF